MAYFPMRQMTCLEMLPEEVWLMIIEQLDNGKDIHNLLLVAPDLRSTFHKKTHLWLLDQVLPHIFKYAQHIVPLRACQRWRRSVDDFLEKHPSRHPYNSSGLTRRNVPYGDFSYLSLDGIVTKYFQSIQDITEFDKKFRTLPINPITGRCATFINCSEVDSIEDFLDASVTLLQTFGRHIYFLELMFDNLSCEDIEDCARNLGQVLRCLAYAPNLKSLKIHVSFENYDALKHVFKIRRIQFPALRYLESLEIHQRTDPALNEALVIVYCLQNANLQKLQTYVGEHDFDVGMFRNITEFCLHHDSDQNILEILKYWQCPRIKKLKLFSVVGGKLSVSNLFGLLATFSVEELQITDCEIMDEQIDYLPRLPTIKYFRVTDAFTHNLDFVKVLTAMEHLRLDWHDNYFPNGFAGADGKQMPAEDCVSVSPFTAKVRKYMYRPFNLGSRDIWKDLAAVKIVTVGGKGDVCIMQFARECGNTPFPLNWMEN